MTHIRAAVLQDAPSMAQVYQDAWCDAYPGILPDKVLLGLSLDRLEVMWRERIRLANAASGALVAEDANGTIVGVGSFGLNQDQELPYKGEVFTLYVDPAHLGTGIGRTLLQAMLRRLSDNGIVSALVWTLSLNPSRFFYEALGAKPVARKHEYRWGVELEQTAYGWPDLDRAAITGPRDELPRN